MPRRKEPFLGIGSQSENSKLDTSKISHTVVDGARRQVSSSGAARASNSSPAATFDHEATRKCVASVVAAFPELALVQERDQLVQDLTFAIGATLKSGLHLLVAGADTKPAQWDKANLLRSVAASMASHGLPVKVSEYEATSGGPELRQSLFLRVVQEVARVGGITLPKDVKGLALRAEIPALQPPVHGSGSKAEEP